MEKRFIMLWNGGVYHGTGGKNVFTLAQLETEFREHMGFDRAQVRNTDDIDDEQHELDTLDDLFDLMISAGDTADPHYIWERELCELGDDYVAASLVEVLA